MFSKINRSRNGTPQWSAAGIYQRKGNMIAMMERIGGIKNQRIALHRPSRIQRARKRTPVGKTSPTTPLAKIAKPIRNQNRDSTPHPLLRHVVLSRVKGSMTDRLKVDRATKSISTLAFIARFMNR
jgi:hypothetical protein